MFPVTTSEKSRMCICNIFTNQCYAVIMCSENHLSEPCSARKFRCDTGSGFSDLVVPTLQLVMGHPSVYPQVTRCQLAQRWSMMQLSDSQYRRISKYSTQISVYTYNQSTNNATKTHHNLILGIAGICHSLLVPILGHQAAEAALNQSQVPQFIFMTPGNQKCLLTRKGRSSFFLVL